MTSTSASASPIADLTERERYQLDVMLKEIRQRADYHLNRYKPYFKQQLFHAAGKHHRERLLRAGNQNGKCRRSTDTLEVLVDGVPTPVRLVDLYNDGAPFTVQAWDAGNHKTVVARAIQPIRKPTESLYRVFLSNGQWFDCDGRHRILRQDGSYDFVRYLLRSSHNLRRSSWAFSLLTRVPNAPRWTGTVLGFLVGCQPSLRSRGGPPLLVPTAAPASAPSPYDVPDGSPIPSAQACPAEPTRSRTRQHQRTSPRASQGAEVRYGGQCVGSSARTWRRRAQQLTHSVSSFWRRLSVATLRLRSDGAAPPLSLAATYGLCLRGGPPSCRTPAPQPSYSRAPEQLPHGYTSPQTAGALARLRGLLSKIVSLPYSLSPNVNGGKIIAHYRIESTLPEDQWVYDFTVPYYENYISEGIVHHNTFAGGMEHAYHCTGLYPDWWLGRRITNPNPVIWASSDTGETTRDNPQRALLGLVGEFGTGSIPKHCIMESKTARGVVDLIDYAKIQHHDADGNPDGLTTLRFKYYEQGRQRWQGPPVDAIWFDEEPPHDIYAEGLARTIATGGFAFTTFTPLLGMSEVVRMFLKDPGPDRHDTNMTIEDALHITQEQRDKVIAAFRPHEREARAKGIPILGSGRIFPVSEDNIKYDPHKLANGPGVFPSHFVQIGGLDFGWDHPTAAVRLVWDRDADIVYVTQAYKRSEASVLEHCGALRPWDEWLPWAWPHDGLAHDKGSGETLADQYRHHGLLMLDERATFEDGGNGVEAGVLEMLDRMQTGRLLVANHLEDWFDEFRLYHRENGKIVKEYDDLLAATRYAMMMLREAVLPGGVDLSARLDYTYLRKAVI